MTVRDLAAPVIAVLVLGTGAQGAWDVGGSFGTLSTGEAIGRGEVSVFTGLSHGDALTAFGGLRYGIADNLDGRLKIGLRDEGGTDAELVAGIDLMYQGLRRDTYGGDPIDLGFGGMAELWNSEAYDIWQLGGFAVGSYPYRLGNQMILTPYARLNVRTERISPEGDAAVTRELELGFNGGGRLDVTRSFSVYGEFQIDGNDGVFIGAEFFLR